MLDEFYTHTNTYTVLNLVLGIFPEVVCALLYDVGSDVLCELVSYERLGKYVRTDCRKVYTPLETKSKFCKALVKLEVFRFYL